MTEIGSAVIYMGKQWNNQVYGTQPAWGLKKSSSDDENLTITMVDKKKSFAELLKEAMTKREG